MEEDPITRRDPVFMQKEQEGWNQEGICCGISQNTLNTFFRCNFLSTIRLLQVTYHLAMVNYGDHSYEWQHHSIFGPSALLYNHLLDESWKDDDSIEWFRRPYWSKGMKLNGFSSHESKSGRSKDKRKDGFGFSKSEEEDDDDDIENIVQSAFGREGFYYWDSSRGGNFQRRCSSGHNRKCFSDWKDETDEETDDDTGPDTCPQPDLASERLTLGLTASGPLKLKDIKSAHTTPFHPNTRPFRMLEEMGKL